MKLPHFSVVLSRRNIDLLPQQSGLHSLPGAGGPTDIPLLANLVSNGSPHSRPALGRLGSAPIQPFSLAPFPLSSCFEMPREG